jgi:hypothetical protein
MFRPRIAVPWVVVFVVGGQVTRNSWKTCHSALTVHEYMLSKVGNGNSMALTRRG